MRGVKYNISIKKMRCDHDDDKIEFYNLPMNEAIDIVKIHMEEITGQPIKVTRWILCNLLNRPKTTDQLLRTFVTISKAEKEDKPKKTKSKKSKIDEIE